MSWETGSSNTENNTKLNTLIALPLPHGGGGGEYEILGYFDGGLIKRE